MSEEVYVVRSAEFEPAHYAALPTLEEAKDLISRLEDLAEERGEYELSFDYDIVPWFDSANQAYSVISEEEAS